MLLEDKLIFRRATKSDLEDIYNLIKALSEYEKRVKDFTATLEDLNRYLFCDEIAIVYLVEIQGETTPIGYLLYYPIFGSFSSSKNVHLEDFYLDKKYRSQGIGRWMFSKFIELLKKGNYSKIEWSSLDWNLPSIGFYKHLGAREDGGRVYFEFDL